MYTNMGGFYPPHNQGMLFASLEFRPVGRMENLSEGWIRDLRESEFLGPGSCLVPYGTKILHGIKFYGCWQNRKIKIH